MALKELQLAANDASRGVLTGPRLERVKSNIQALVNDLGNHEDVEPPAKETEGEPVAPPQSDRPAIRQPAAAEELPGPERLPEPWRRPGAVMCIAGRGPLDEAAATMLAQLLEKHGLGTQVVPHEAVSRSAIMGLDVTGVEMVCLSYLEISGTPASALSAAPPAPAYSGGTCPRRTLAGRRRDPQGREAALGRGSRL